MTDDPMSGMSKFSSLMSSSFLAATSIASFIPSTQPEEVIVAKEERALDGKALKKALKKAAKAKAEAEGKVVEVSQVASIEPDAEALLKAQKKKEKAERKKAKQAEIEKTDIVDEEAARALRKQEKAERKKAKASKA